jgi:hypothetical protein
MGGACSRSNQNPFVVSVVSRETAIRQTTAIFAFIADPFRASRPRPFILPLSIRPLNDQDGRSTTSRLGMRTSREVREITENIAVFACFHIRPRPDCFQCPQSGIRDIRVEFPPLSPPSAPPSLCVSAREYFFQ